MIASQDIVLFADATENILIWNAKYINGLTFLSPFGHVNFYWWCQTHNIIIYPVNCVFFSEIPHVMRLNFFSEFNRVG